MHDVALLQEIQSEEELFGIYPDGPNVQSNIFAKAFDDVTKIHAVVTVRTFLRVGCDRYTSKIRRQYRGARGVQKFALAGRHAFCHLGLPA